MHPNRRLSARSRTYCKDKEKTVGFKPRSGEYNTFDKSGNQNQPKSIPTTPPAMPNRPLHSLTQSELFAEIVFLLHMNPPVEENLRNYLEGKPFSGSTNKSSLPAVYYKQY
jgi:hypothetical protein